MSRLSPSIILVWSPDGVSLPVNDATQDGVSFPLNLDGYVTSSTFTSVPVYLGNVDAYSLAFTCPSTGSPVGTVGLQACNDRPRLADQPDSKLANWIPLYFLPQGGSTPVSTQSVSGATQVLFEELVCSYRWVRLVYTATSGSITATAKIQIKGAMGS